MEWTFPSMDASDADDEAYPTDNLPEPEDEPDATVGYQDKRDTRTWTFPVMTPDEGATTTNNNDHAGFPRRGSDDSVDMSLPFPSLQPAPLSSRPRTITAVNTNESRPSTSQSNWSSASEADYDPFRFDRQDDAQEETDDFPSFGDTEGYDGAGQNGYHLEGRASEATSVYSREDGWTASAPFEAGQEPHPHFAEPVPPNPESLAENAPHAVQTGEMDRLLGDLVHSLNVVGAAFESWEETDENGGPAEQSQ
jgi:hypothetical protein